MTIGEWLLSRAARHARRDADRARARRDWVGAARLYRRYLMYAPDDSAILIQLGHVSAEMEDHEAAEHAYAAAARRTPDDADLLLCWGHLHKRMGDAAGARTLYARSFAVDGNARAAEELARIPPPAEARYLDPEAGVARGNGAHAAESGPYAGRVHRAEGTTIHAVVLAPGGAETWLEYWAGERRVGKSLLNGAYRDGEGYAAKAVVDLDREEMVSVRRMPGNAELDNSPILVSPLRREEAAPPAWSVRLAVVKPFPISAGGEVALFVAAAADAMLAPRLYSDLRTLRTQDIAVLLIVLTDCPLVLPEALLDLVAGAVVRVPDGGALAGWAHALELYSAAYGASMLYLIDGSIASTVPALRFATTIERVRSSRADFVGLAGSHVPRWQLEQSFLALKPRLLSSARFQRFMHRLGIAEESARSAQLLALAEEIERTGHKITVLWPGGHEDDPAPRGRCPSIDPDSPVIGLDRPSRSHPEIDAAGAAGPPAKTRFDLAGIAAEPLSTGAGPAGDAYDPQNRARPRSVAFYGPWNYEGEMGDRARAAIAALRRLDVRLNLHPVSPPFHHRRTFGPDVDIIDSPETPDVAIVQLEPDDWHRLSHAQRDALRRAGRRIACWSGATARPDEDWWHHFPTVDRIWTFDRSGADRLALHADAPVDIVPLDMPHASEQGTGKSGVVETAMLGGEAVSRRMAASLNATVAGRSAPDFVHRTRIRLLAALPPEAAQLDATVHVLMLDRDGGPRPRRPLPVDRGNWIVIVPEGSVITPLLGRILLDHARRRPDVQIFYADDVAAKTEHPIDQLRLKPAFDLTLLAAQDYIGAPIMVCADAFHALDGLRADRKTAAVADMLFRAHERGMSIERIAEVLLAHPQRRPTARPADYRAMLAAQPLLADYQITAGRTPDSCALVRRFPPARTPRVTIVVPTCRAMLPGTTRTCIERLLESIAQVDWPMSKLTVVVGDDHVETPDWESAAWPFTLRRIATPRAAGKRFNYAAKMNALWRSAATEQIVFMNDDVAALEPGWLKALQTFALDPGVGGVGARLLFEDGRLQHAGLAPHGAGAGHVWVHRWQTRGTYQDWAQVHREWSMVTGAVFATRRSLMEQVNGFDEGFALEFNDSDLCLKLRSLGYRIVCTPHAEMVHAEKLSRGDTLPRGDEVARFASRWRPWLNDDPSWHPRLRLDRIDMTPQADESAWYV